MPNLPIRGLGAVGVVTDADPYNLPINGFTRAKNVRFTEGKVEHGPVYRDVSAPITSFNPMFASGIYALDGYDTVVVVDELFTVRQFQNGAFRVDGGGNDYPLYTVSDPSNPPSSLKVTHTTLADVQYINRPNRVPIAQAPAASNNAFSPLPNWDLCHRTKALRSFGDFLVALNMTENGAAYPNRVRFSNIALANNVPNDWTGTVAGSSAGFVDLVQMSTPIIDGATLGPNFLIYSQDQVWMMEFVGGTFIFNFRKIFDDAGVISQNCIVEVGGRHYVFDRDDIYVTDGNTRESICEGRVRDYIFSGIDLSKADKSFVLHNNELEEVYFCYHSGDDMAEFADGDCCNRAAVYNYRDDTWTFQDLPNVVAGTLANMDSTVTYTTATQTYENVGGSYHSQESSFQRHPLLLSRQYTVGGVNKSESRILGVDTIDTGSLSQSLNSTLSKPALLERTGIDLDEQNVPLSGYKVINRVYPQISTPNSNNDFRFNFGAADIPTGVPNYGASTVFDAAAGYKVDTRMAGRYLSYKLATDTFKDFAFTGMDIDVVVTGKR